VCLLNKKYFSVEEANRILPKIKYGLLKLMKINRAIEVLNSVSIEYEDNYSALVNDVRINKTFHRLYYNLYKEIDNILDLGVVLEDLELGIINLYSMYEDREIFLCWRLGEKRIKFWHEIDEDYFNRKPISILLKNL